MKLEQTIQRSKKGTGGIIGQRKKESYVTEWELVYHEVLSISRCFADMTKSALFKSDAVSLHHEHGGHSTDEFNESVEKGACFIEQRDNPYTLSLSTKLYHFTTGQLVPDEISKKLLNAYEHGKDQYITFRNERYVTKEKKLVDTIKQHSILPFIPKADSKSNSSSSAKETAKNVKNAQKYIDIAQSHGFLLNEILTYDHFRNHLFDGEQTTKPEKSQIIGELEKLLIPADWYFVKKKAIKSNYCRRLYVSDPQS